MAWVNGVLQFLVLLALKAAQGHQASHHQHARHVQHLSGSASHKHGFQPSHLHLPADVYDWRFPDVGQWGKSTGSEHPLLAERFWRAHHLTNALWAPGHEQFIPLLHRLHHGQPINVVALGGPITAAAGGAFQCAPGALLTAITSAPPAYDPASGAAWRTQRGWLSLFMAQVNASWPNPDHLLVNLGSSQAWDLRVATDACLADLVPERVDLWVVELMGRTTSSISLEQLIYRLLHHASARNSLRPAILLLNSALLPSSRRADWARCAGGAKPLRACAQLCAAPAGAEAARDMSLSTLGIVGDATTRVFRARGRGHDVLRVGSYYSCSVLSLRQLVVDLWRHASPQQQRGESEGGGAWSSTCAVMARLLAADGVLPSELGKLLLADVVWNVLRVAHQAAADWPGHTPPPMPAATLHHQGAWAVAAREVQRCAVLDGVVIAGSGASVLASDGWAAPLRYGERGGPRAWLQAEKPGAALTLRVDVHMQGAAAAAAAAPGGSNRLVVSFVKAAEGMGQASVTCESGCSCLPAVLDAHLPTPQGSVDKAFPVLHQKVILLGAGHEHCTLKVQVGKDTSSGGHMFRLVGLLASVVLPPANTTAVVFAPWQPAS